MGIVLLFQFLSRNNCWLKTKITSGDEQKYLDIKNLRENPSGLANIMKGTLIFSFKSTLADQRFFNIGDFPILQSFQSIIYL